MKALELPSVPTKILFGKSMDKTHLERVRTVAQNYFDAILSDDKLCNSELIYAYLSPSPEHLKQVEIQRKKSKFSFSTFFKGYLSSKVASATWHNQILYEYVCDGLTL